MITKAASFIQDKKLIQKKDIITAAVSGGRDSMALLHFLNKLKDSIPFELRACHINHGIRGEDADLDERLVREQCERMAVPLQVEHLFGFDLSSSEDALREARYNVFSRILVQDKRIKIATAHHLDDQLETFLMRLAKGSYFKGLTGIPASRPGFIRPFLWISRKEIDRYVLDNNILFREDFTNVDTSKLRNRIRHHITPVLLSVFGNEFYRGFKKSLTDLKSVYDDYYALNSDSFSSILKKKEEAVTFSVRKYQEFSDNRKRLFTEYCISLFNPLNSFLIKYSFAEFNRFVETSATGARFYFSKDLSAIKDRAEIRLILDETENGQIDVLLDLNGSAAFSDGVVILSEASGDHLKFTDDHSIEYICGDHLNFPLRLRNWHFGDVFYPLGLRGKQKLSNFFINSKIPLDRKRKILVLQNGEDIVWVVGMRIDNRYRLTKNCKRIIKMVYQIKKD